MTRRVSTEPARAPTAAREDRYDLVSPVSGETLERVRLATREEIIRAAARLAGRRVSASREEIFFFLRRLKDQLALRRDRFIERTVSETGFITRDSEETVDAAIDFLSSFETYVEQFPESEPTIRHSYSAGSYRGIRLTSRSYGIVAAVVPQNASLALGITIIASALYAGSRVLLRPSLQTACTGALLAEALDASHPPAGLVEVANCLAGDFIDACCSSEHVDVIHYIGSNQHALQVLSRAFSAGKVCFLDGQGNGLLYVDGSFPVAEAARLITEGATRFNGETCTSVNGVLVEESAFPSLKAVLVESFAALTVGNPFDPETQVGPLFSERQARDLGEKLHGARNGRVLVGGSGTGAYLTPSIVEGIGPDDPLVREGLFGPAVWIAPVNWQSAWNWIRCNRFPLSDTVLSARPEVIREFAARSRAARICVNSDPSIESMFEPWGGYPPSGLNPVSLWIEKYRQAYQLDGRLDQIRAVEEVAGLEP